MNVDHVHHFYGQKKEIEYLQRVIQANLKRGHDTSCHSKGLGPECSSTVATDVTSPSTSTSSTSDDGPCICNENLESGSPYDSKSISSDCRLVLISGPDGCGKRTLAYEALNKYLALKPCCRSSFWQVSGQFRTYQGNVRAGNPYTNGRSREFEHSFPAFTDAIKELIDILLQDDEMQHTVLTNLKLLLKDPKDALILMQTFPCMKMFLRQEPLFCFDDKIPEVYCRVFLRGTPTAGERLQFLCYAVVSFFQAVSRFMPLVLVLEDLQHACAESLVLLEALMKNADDCSSQRMSSGLLMVATFVVSADEAISDTVMSLLRQDSGDAPGKGIPVGLFTNGRRHHIHHVALSNLSWDDVHEWTMHWGEVIPLVPTDQKRAISDLVFHHTNGNPFHVRYLLHFLQLENTLLSDPIHKKSVPRTVVELYTSMLLQQDVSVLNLVRSAAALSRCSEMGIVDCELLRVSMKIPCVDEVLEAHECGLLDFFPSRGYVRFSRKALQMAAYDTIPDPSMLHLAIGRSLWKDAIMLHDQGKATDDEMKQMILHAMMHLRNHVDVLLDVDERMQLSKICYECGVSSSQLGDFATSAEFFEFAIFALGPDLWRSDLYETCLVLHNAAAQTFFYVCDVDKTEQTLETIFRNAKSFDDKIPAYIILVYARAKSQMKEGFRIISFVLSELGEPIRQKPNTIAVYLDLLRMKWALLGKSYEALSNLPVASEKDQIISHFLSFAMFFIFIVDNETSVFLSRRIMRFSVKNGITGPAAVAFAQYSYTLCELRKFEEGYRFGQLALTLADRFEIWRPRIHMYLYGFTLLWFYPFRNSLEPLFRAQSDAIRYGDLQVYGALAAFILPISLVAGLPLKRLHDDALSYLRSLAEVGQTNPLIFSIPFWSTIKDLTGSKETLGVEGEIQDADAAFKYAMKEGIIVMHGYFYAFRAMFYFLVANYPKSLEMTKKAYDTLISCSISVNVAFFDGLATLAIAWTMKSHERRNHINHCRKLSREIKELAHRSPENFRNKHLLLEAEIAALKGKSSLALTLYETSVTKAKQEEFLHEAGIAYERWGLYLLHIGNTSDAVKRLESARALFDQWGANIVVERVNQLIASIQQRAVGI